MAWDAPPKGLAFSAVPRCAFLYCLSCHFWSRRWLRSFRAVRRPRHFPAEQGRGGVRVPLTVTRPRVWTRPGRAALGNGGRAATAHAGRARRAQRRPQAGGAGEGERYRPPAPPCAVTPPPQPGPARPCGPAAAQRSPILPARRPCEKERALPPARHLAAPARPPRAALAAPD